MTFVWCCKSPSMVCDGIFWTVWFNFDKGPVVAMRGSPWRYDTHVPIIFAGAGVRAGTVHRLVHPVDVAPILSALLGMTAPGAEKGTILTEVLGDDTF